MFASVAETSSGIKTSSRFARLKAAAVIGCVLVGTMPATAQTTPANPPAAPGLPPEPTPNYTQPLFLHPTARDFARARGYYPSPFGPYRPTRVQPPNFMNSPQLSDLVKNGRIYLSLNDAVLLALQNNYDIAIQRLNLDIADTDILRSRSGGASSSPLGTSTALETNTLGGSGSAVTATTGAPGGSSVSGTGAGGIVLSTLGAGPSPETFDPDVQGTIQLQREKTPSTNTLFSGGLPAITTNTDEYNFTYAQGFAPGTSLQISFTNNRVTTDNPFYPYSPQLNSMFNAQITQHLLQGFGVGLNRRFIVQALNDRRIADSVFRSQLLYTINQVEDIYWGLVSAYDNLEAKQRALDQSTSLEKDDERELQVGAMAPLDVVNARSQVSTDDQALIAARSALEYQQLLMKQAIARNLDDPTLANAPVIPTDRVSIAETPEERMSTDDLVREAEANSPAIEQAMLDLKNDKITLKAVKNGLLPTLDAYAFYGATATGGSQSPNCLTYSNTGAIVTCPAGTYPGVGYGSVLQNLGNSSGPNKGAGFTLNIPIRNRTAQAEQERAELEYRQAELRLQQLYVQVRMQVTNDQYALTNDRAAVTAAEAGVTYNQQSLDADIRKLHLGADTTADVLQQQRNLAGAQYQLISDRATYAIDRAALEEALASTLDRYSISIVDAATGHIQTPPNIPGVVPATGEPEIVPPTQKQELRKQEQNPQSQPQAEQP